MKSESSDDELLQATASGDRQAFEQYYRRNAPWLEIRLRRRCGDADDPAADRRAPTATRSRDDYR